MFDFQKLTNDLELLKKQYPKYALFLEQFNIYEIYNDYDLITRHRISDIALAEPKFYSIYMDFNKTINYPKLNCGLLEVFENDVYCLTHKECIVFLKILNDYGVRWVSGDSLLSCTFYGGRPITYFCKNRTSTIRCNSDLQQGKHCDFFIKY